MIFYRLPDVNHLLIGIFKYLSQKVHFFPFYFVGISVVGCILISCHSSFPGLLSLVLSNLIRKSEWLKHLGEYF